MSLRGKMVAFAPRKINDAGGDRANPNSDMRNLHVVIASLLLAVGCGPTVKEMPVLAFTKNWELGEVRECETQAPSSNPLSKGLICSYADYTSALLVAGPPAGDITKDTKIFSVKFKGSGRPSVYQNCTDWHCRKTVDGISCE
jgi:hypothetical protein